MGIKKYEYEQCHVMGMGNNSQIDNSGSSTVRETSIVISGLGMKEIDLVDDDDDDYIVNYSNLSAFIIHIHSIIHT